MAGAVLDFDFSFLGPLCARACVCCVNPADQPKGKLPLDFMKSARSQRETFQPLITQRRTQVAEYDESRRIDTIYGARTSNYCVIY